MYITETTQHERFIIDSALHSMFSKVARAHLLSASGAGMG